MINNPSLRGANGDEAYSILFFVIPAKAGISGLLHQIPACAGMTSCKDCFASLAMTLLLIFALPITLANACDFKPIIDAEKNTVGILTRDMRSDDPKLRACMPMKYDMFNDGEDECSTGTVAFAGTKKAIGIRWGEGSEYGHCDNYIWNLKPPAYFSHPTSVDISGLSAWKTSQGIHIGTTLQELEKINGAPLHCIMAIDTDGYSNCFSESHKNISKSFRFFLDMTYPEKLDKKTKAYYDKNLNQVEFMSDSIPAEFRKALNLHVSGIEYNFSD